MRSLIDLKKDVTNILDSYDLKINPARSADKSRWNYVKKHFTIEGGSFFKGKTGRLNSQALRVIVDTTPEDQIAGIFLKNLFQVALKAENSSSFGSSLAQSIMQLVARELNIKRICDSETLQRRAGMPGPMAIGLIEDDSRFYARIYHKLLEMTAPVKTQSPKK